MGRRSASQLLKGCHPRIVMSSGRSRLLATCISTNDEGQLGHTQIAVHKDGLLRTTSRHRRDTLTDCCFWQRTSLHLPQSATERAMLRTRENTSTARTSNNYCKSSHSLFCLVVNNIPLQSRGSGDKWVAVPFDVTLFLQHTAHTILERCSRRVRVSSL